MDKFFPSQMYDIYIVSLLSLCSLILLGLLPNRSLNQSGYNLIFLIITLELFLFGISLTFAHLSFVLDDKTGVLVSYLILPIAGCESALALSILINYYPRRGSLVIS